tara:strand:+ start:230 stop:451 length:222 start_codon:yes stop_codon:yes gene_type:complete
MATAVTIGINRTKRGYRIMLNVRKNAYNGESMTNAYWRLKQQRDDKRTGKLFIGYAIALSAYCAWAVMGIAHF